MHSSACFYHSLVFKTTFPFIFRLFFCWLGQEKFLKIDGLLSLEWNQTAHLLFNLGSTRPHQTGGSQTSVLPILLLSASIWATLIFYCFKEHRVCVYTGSEPGGNHDNCDAWLFPCSPLCWEKTFMARVQRWAPPPALWMVASHSTRGSNQILWAEWLNG